MHVSTIDSEGFKGGTRGAPIMPRDTVSRTAHVGTVGTNGLNYVPTQNVGFKIKLIIRGSGFRNIKLIM